MTDVRQVLQELVTQGVDEIISYKLTTTPWGGAPLNPNLKVLQKNGLGWKDMTATNAPSGSPTVNGDVITFQPIRNLVDGRTYRAIFKWEFNGNTLSAYLDILAGT